MNRVAHGEPIRTCVGCGERAPQRALVRVRVTADGRLSEYERRGRSAYLHARTDCVRALVRSKGLSRALRTTIAKGPRAEHPPQHRRAPKSKWRRTLN